MKKVFQLKLEKCLCVSVFKSLSIVICQLSFVLLSCSDEADRTENITGTVGFHVADVAASRAAILTNLEADGFRVSAYSTGATAWETAKDNAYPEFMWNQPVTWTGSAWTYGTAKYWPGNNGRISFFAWNDVGTGLSVSAHDATGAPTLTYAVPNAQSDQKDLVTATAMDLTAEDGAVALSFGHVLSRIGFTARPDQHYDDVTITVTSLKVKYATGKVRRTDDYTFGTGWALTGTDCMSHTGGGDVLVDTPVALNNDETPAKTPLTTDTRANYLMLLPQTVEAGDVMIDVVWTVDGTPHNRSLNLPHQVWLPGKRYDYNLTVSMTGITLDPVAVNPWGDNDLYTPITITYKTPDGTDIVEYRTTNVSYPVSDYTFPLYPDFDGWNTNAEGTGDTYRAGGNIECTGDLTLFAQWTGRTNCYMVKPGETVKFRVSRAYEDDGASTTLRNGTGPHTGTFTIEEVWDPDNLVTATVDNGSGPDAMITVTAAGGSGNALVAITPVGSSDIAWSYHIWVTDYPGDNTVTMVNGHEFMDRNLGATNNDLSTAAYGLLYQWGRKDPFRNSSDPTFIESSSTTGNIIYTIKNPVTFLYTVGSRTQNDWHYSSRDNTLWNETKDGKDIKTIYDPCPAGWRVPAYKDNIADKAHSPWMEYDNDNYTTELAGLARETTGYKFTHKNNYEAYYPRAGYRANGSGNFSSSNGRYWSASPYDSRIAYLYVAGYIDAADNFYGRACGHSVRCARE